MSNNQVRVEVKNVVLEQAGAKVSNLRAIELADTGFGPQLSLDDNASRPFNFGVIKSRKIELALEAIKQFNAKHKDYVATPRSSKSTSKATPEVNAEALKEVEAILSKYSK